MRGQSFRNTYEQTSGRPSTSSTRRPRPRARDRAPSIVMGESGSGWTPAFNVLYWPIRARSRAAVRWRSRPVRKPLVDVVPVDYVADALVHLLETSSSGVVNLVSGGEACSVDDLVGMTSAAFGRETRPSSRPARPAPAPPPPTTTPRCTSRTSTWTWSSTTRGHRALLVRRASSAHLTDYFPRLIEYAQETRWGKAPPDARRGRGRARRGVAR